jgi:hypothetical protein
VADYMTRLGFFHSMLRFISEVSRHLPFQSTLVMFVIFQHTLFIIHGVRSALHGPSLGRQYGENPTEKETDEGNRLLRVGGVSRSVTVIVWKPAGVH